MLGSRAPAPGPCGDLPRVQLSALQAPAASPAVRWACPPSAAPLRGFPGLGLLAGAGEGGRPRWQPVSATPAAPVSGWKAF